MSWNGDIAQVGQLAQRMGELSHVPSRIAARVAEELADEIQAEFDAGTDPYGEPWAPLAPATEARGRTAPPLDASGNMRDGIRVAPMRGAGIAITVPHPGQIHQTGWDGPLSSGPPRPILPGRGELPAAWRGILETAADDEFRKALR